MTFLITYIIETLLIKLAAWTALFCVSCFIVGATITCGFLYLLLFSSDDEKEEQ